MKKEKFIQICEENGWEVNDFPDSDYLCISRFTDAGQDFFIEICDEYYTHCRFKEYLENYYESYDPDYETLLWLDSSGHGSNGAPYRMRDILDDMESVEYMIGELIHKL